MKRKHARVSMAVLRAPSKARCMSPVRRNKRVSPASTRMNNRARRCSCKARCATKTANRLGMRWWKSGMPIIWAAIPSSIQARRRSICAAASAPTRKAVIVSAPGYRKLTTQINIAGDPYLWDDFAFATREGLVPEMTHITDAAAIRKHEVDAPFYSIDFDFMLHAEQADLPKAEIQRDRAAA